MRTNIDIDDRLLARALELTGARTKRAVVDLALASLVAQRERLDLRDLKGHIQFDDGYDPHASRTR